MEKPVLKRKIEASSDSAAEEDSTMPRRGVVINWLDRLVERRIEKVERDIERLAKIAGSSGTH